MDKIYLSSDLCRLTIEGYGYGNDTIEHFM